MSESSAKLKCVNSNVWFFFLQARGAAGSNKWERRQHRPAGAVLVQEEENPGGGGVSQEGEGQSGSAAQTAGMITGLWLVHTHTHTRWHPSGHWESAAPAQTGLLEIVHLLWTVVLLVFFIETTSHMISDSNNSSSHFLTLRKCSTCSKQACLDNLSISAWDSGVTGEVPSLKQPLTWFPGL